MGLKPQQMAQCTLISYPAEWLLDIFNGQRSCPQYHIRLPYVAHIEVPPNYATVYSCGALACFLTLIGILIYWIA